jgi:uncharacterized protein YjbI with pentapeptide repeats
LAPFGHPIESTGKGNAMANAEQLKVLKQDVEVWNRWRAKNNGFDIDLSEADLKRADLQGVSLQNADLRGANLSDAQLGGANLRGANLAGTILRNTSLGGANLREANLIMADLSGAQLFEAYLIDTNLSDANLNGATICRGSLQRANLNGAQLKRVDFREANLWRANFNEANLTESNFSKASIQDTIFGNLDLSGNTGLEDAVHRGPSRISADTFARSRGRIPDIFLRGCGLSDWEIEAAKLYNPDLSNDEVNKILYKMYDLRATQALQISPLFVSYSHADSEFVDKIGNSLNKEGVRYWRDVHDLKAGRMEKQSDRAIRQNPTVLLILSEHSLSSDWVEHEARTARSLEKEMGRDVLCPVALDDRWKSSSWPRRIMEQIMEYNILDFSAWKDDSKFGDMFRKLIDGLELFYKG